MKAIVVMLGLLMLGCGPARAQQMTPLSITGDDLQQPVGFDVETAVSDSDRAHGLMNRTSLAEDKGMLFVFQTAQDTSFWMKNTLIPLDMIFINEDGTIRTIHPMAEPESLDIIKSGGPVKAGLEIKGGLAQELGLKPGDIVHHRVFGNALAQP